MLINGMIVNRLIDDKGNYTKYGVSNIGEHVVVVDLNTKYVNGTKLAARFKTCENKPKRLSHWLHDNKNKVDYITNLTKLLTPRELVNDKITYDVKEIGDIYPVTLNKHCTKPKRTLDIKRVNEKYNTNYYSLNNLVRGTYIHMHLCKCLLHWLDKDNYMDNMDCIDYYYNNNLDIIEILMENPALRDKISTEYAQAKNDHHDVGHIPIIYKSNTLYVVGIDDKLYVDIDDLIYITNVKISSNHIKTFKCIYDMINYTGKHHPLGKHIIDAQYICLNSVYSKLSTNTVNYFNDAINTIKNNDKMLYSKVAELDIPPYELSSELSEHPGLYVLYLGIYDNEHLFKFGITYDINRRLKEHRKAFTNITLIRYISTYRRDDIERDLKNTLRNTGLLRSKEINGKVQTELFTLSDNYVMANLLDTIDILHKRYITQIEDLKHINELQKRIIELEAKLHNNQDTC